MAAKFVTATTVAVRESVEKAGPFVLKAIERWLASPISEEYLPSQIWREALANPIIDIFRSAKPLPAKSLALCAWILPPNTVREVLTSSRRDLQSLARQPLINLPKPLRLPTAFLLVTLGLRGADPEGVRLICRGYFDVYEALATSTERHLNFPWESWLLLSSELPQPGRFRDWDRCKRLRKAIKQWIEKNPQFQSALLAESRSNKHLKIARETIENENDPEDFID